MMRRNIGAPALALVTLLAGQMASAAAIRLDSGDWDIVFTGDSTTTSNIGFTMSFDASVLGITGNSVNVNSAGTLRLFDATTADSADFDPFSDIAQISGGNTTSFLLEQTNAAFSTPGIDAGFRATWTAFDSGGLLVNQFQVGLFDLSSGQTALEFNYDVLTMGGVDTDIGFSTTLGTIFELLPTIGVPIADALGTGDFDPGFPDLCTGTPDALACNNYFDGNFGPSELILSDLAGGYFRSVSGSDSTPSQGRYLFLFRDAAAVTEPPMLALIGAAALAFGLSRRRKR